LYVRTPDLNGRYHILLKNKLIFHLITDAFPDQAVKSFGVIRKGQILFADNSKLSDASDYLLDLLQTCPKLVIKPVEGSGGKNVNLLFRQGEDLYLNEMPFSKAGLRDLVGEMNNDLISCYVEQCPEIAALYPRTVNTVRLLTMQDAESGEPFIAFSILRIGRASSYPVDNWSRGGLSAEIDLETGKLNRGVSYANRSRTLTWHVAHPDSCARIEGVIVPHWQEIKTKMVEICRNVPFLQHVGWDLVVTSDGFRILEGNHHPEINMLQVHRPLLADQRVVRFYRRHQVL
jgi:hypothetical protein